MIHRPYTPRKVTPEPKCSTLGQKSPNSSLLLLWPWGFFGLLGKDVFCTVALRTRHPLPTTPAKYENQDVDSDACMLDPSIRAVLLGEQSPWALTLWQPGINHFSRCQTM